VYRKNWFITDIFAKPVKVFEREEEKECQFLTHIRRPHYYNGSYGLDWLQEEFKNYRSSFKLKEEYKPTKYFGQEYLTPWLSIAKGQTIKINLVVEKLSGTVSGNDTIKLPPQKGLRFSPEEIKLEEITETVKHFPSGEDKGVEIKITCEDTVSSDSIVNIYNQKNEITGRFSLFASSKEYVLPVRVVLLVRKGFEVQDINDLQAHLTTNMYSDFWGKSSIGECMEELERYMNKYAYNQAFVRCKMERKNNTIATHNVVIDEQEWRNKNYINADGKIINRDDLQTDLLAIYKHQIERHSGFFKGIILMITNFEAVDRNGKLLGQGNLDIIDDRNCIIFKSNSVDDYQGLGNIHQSTYIHEIGHVLSLTHPFHIHNWQRIQQNEAFVVSLNQILKDPHETQNRKDELWRMYEKDYKENNRDAYKYYNNKYTFWGAGREKPEEGATQCMYMDYKVNRKVFTQWQWRTIRKSIKDIFKIEQ
jgi:hypothetical protein